MCTLAGHSPDTDSSSPRQHQANDTMIGCAMQGKVRKVKQAQRHENCQDEMCTVSAPFRRIRQVKAGSRPCSDSSAFVALLPTKSPERRPSLASGRPTWCHQMTDIDSPAASTETDTGRASTELVESRSEPKEGRRSHLQIDYLPTY